MALQTSGPISFSDIRDEFETSNPIKMTQFYGKDAKLPGSGKISASDFYGTSNIKKATLLFKSKQVNKSSISVSFNIPGLSWKGQVWLIVAASSGKDGGGLPTPTAYYSGVGMKPDTSITRYVNDFDNSGDENNRVTLQAMKLASGISAQAIAGTVTVTGIESNNRGGTNETAIWVLGDINDGTIDYKSGSVGTLANSNQCLVVGLASAGKWNSATTEISGAVKSNWDEDYGGVGLCLSSGLEDVSVSGGQGRGAFWLKI
jgi:hypothetical protein